jgi:hypothetical protein
MAPGGISPDDEVEGVLRAIYRQYPNSDIARLLASIDAKRMAAGSMKMNPAAKLDGSQVIDARGGPRPGNMLGLPRQEPNMLTYQAGDDTNLGA